VLSHQNAALLDGELAVVDEYEGTVESSEAGAWLAARVGAATAVLAGSFGASLLHDVYADRRRQYAMLLALGFRPMQRALTGIAFGLATVGASASWAASWRSCLHPSISRCPR